ncbi:hypothetical protein E2C01_080483 [Portunus trituberculatus]|uniref:Uncharacterized protein n=1 Tax=Portunus trituberculatus TaxID=210409 RepID=A0A5B7IU75_PORTR|nr:hypothetical protein [Portunus trituberculatus]
MEQKGRWEEGKGGGRKEREKRKKRYACLAFHQILSRLLVTSSHLSASEQRLPDPARDEKEEEEEEEEVKEEEEEQEQLETQRKEEGRYKTA